MSVAVLVPKKKHSLLLGLALVCGILFDYLFYGKAVGISYPLYLLVFYALFFWGLHEKINIRFEFGWLLLIPILLLSLTYGMFSNPIFRILNGLAIPVLVATQTILITSSSPYKWYNIRLMGNVLDHLFPQSIKNAIKPLQLVMLGMKQGIGGHNYKVVGRILIGLLISLPLLVIVISLLASADEVFEQAIVDIPRFLDNIELGPWILRCFLIAVVSIYLFGYIWGMMYPRQHDREVEEQGNPSHSSSSLAPSITRTLSLDPIISITVLLSVNLVYILFTVIQFSYFFGGGEGVLPSGMGYADYARKGFGELVIVTMINFSVLLIVLNFLARESRLIYKFIQIMLSLLVGSTIVMLCSAFFRLSLYEQVYGYTYSRILAHAFMIFLLILFLIACYKIWWSNTSLFRTYMVLSLIAYVLINYINIDVIIANKNIERYVQSGKIDVRYLGRLSYDAVPRLVLLHEHLSGQDDPVSAAKKMGRSVSGTEENRVENEPENEEYRNVVASEVSEQIQRILLHKKADLRDDRAWQSFNLSKYRAKKILRDL